MVVERALLSCNQDFGVRPQKRADAPQLGKTIKTGLLSLLTAVAALYLNISQAQAEEYNFANNRTIWGDHTVHTGADYPLSPFRPQTPQYQQFNELDKHDKRIALAQIAAQLIAHNLDNKLGKAILSVREPLGGGRKNFKCGHKFNFKKYFMTCKIRF